MTTPDNRGMVTNRGMLTLIVIFTAITALVAVVFGIFWASAAWKTHQAISAIEEVDLSYKTSEIAGVWTGGDIGQNSTLTLDSNDRLDGVWTTVFESSSCSWVWTETSRDYGGVFVESHVQPGGGSNCTDGEFYVQVTGSTLTAVKKWGPPAPDGTPFDPDDVPTFTMHKDLR